MSQPKFEKIKPKKLPEKRQKAKGELLQYDSPGCCDIIINPIYWNSRHWVWLTEIGNTETQVHFCMFCGVQLYAHTPARKP